MRVLVVNNFVRGASGVDGVVRMECEGLKQRGHQIEVFSRDNRELDAASGLERVRLLASCAYSFGARKELEHRLRTLDSDGLGQAGSGIDLVHVHNTVPLLSGAVWDALIGQPTPVVLHLHNYRAFCLSSYLYRDGSLCDDCRRTAHLACAVHGCYRKSRSQSGALMIARWIDMAKGRPWGDAADAYIACSEWVRRRYVERGLAPQRVWVVPNSAVDYSRLVGHVVEPGRRRARLSFVGSLIRPKGVFRALDLARDLNEFEFHFFGDGADRSALESRVASERLRNVVVHGVKHGEAFVRPWSESFLTLAPSLWDEPFPLVAPESFSLGIPVLTTGMGGLSESVTDDETGLIDSFADTHALAARVRALWSDSARYEWMCHAARETYKRTYTPGGFTDRLETALEDILAQYRRGAIARRVGGKVT